MKLYGFKFKGGDWLMDEYKILNELSKNRKLYSRKDIETVIRDNNTLYNKNSLSSLLNKWIKKGYIRKEARNCYKIIIDNAKKSYSYVLSEFGELVYTEIKNNYPDLNYQVWEISQLNEFINHQISRDVVIIETEEIYTAFIFDNLNNKIDNVLLKPTIDIFNLYSKDRTVVVKQMITESPRLINSNHKIPIEKLMVDCVVDKFTSKLISSNELKNFYEIAFKVYEIDLKKLVRYASRRNSKKKIMTYIPEFIKKEGN